MALMQAKTEYGWVQGAPGINQANTIFKGIPFAKAPVGDLRWKAPQPLEPWEGVLETIKFGPIAMQAPYTSSEGGGIIADEFYAVDHPRGEDCLYLNVWTPAKSADEKLPVGVYIHGGGYSTGYSYLNCYDGEGFNKRDIIIVTIPYRLNVFGCLAHPWLSAESGHGSGNYGPLDQIEGIKWVKRNIAAFGGDPDNITIFGQSAGGGSVQTMSCSPLTEGLFQRAIMQSGGGLPPLDPARPAMTLERAEEIGVKFFDFMGFKSLEEARAASAQEIFDGYQKFTAETKLRASVAIDGYVLPASQRDIILAGKHHDIQYMIGAAGGESVRTAVSGMAWCENQVNLNRTPSYMFYFTYVPPGAESAHHSVEHHYVFQTFNRSHRPYGAFDFDLSNELADYWANFIKCGNPNGSGEAKWLPYTAEAPEVLEITREARKMTKIPMTNEMLDMKKRALN